MRLPNRTTGLCLIAVTIAPAVAGVWIGLTGLIWRATLMVAEAASHGVKERQAIDGLDDWPRFGAVAAALVNPGPLETSMSERV